MKQQNLIELTADIVAAHVANNSVAVGDMANLVQKVHQALSSLGNDTPAAIDVRKPIVSVRASIRPDYLVCMSCGNRQKTLKRHLMTAHNMTPAQYRAAYDLPGTYPMTSPNYSDRRRAMAHSIGLGTKGVGRKKKKK